MKKTLALIPLLALLLLIPAGLSLTYTKYSTVPSIKVEGNCSSSTGYIKTYIGTAQLNSSIESSEETVFESKFNISANGTVGACTITMLNYTIEEDYSVNDRTKIDLLNSSRIFQGHANSTVAGTYPTGIFNWTIATVTNTTNTTFYVRWHLDEVDDHRSISKSIVGQTLYKENVSYTAPKTVDLKNVTLVYKPTQWEHLFQLRDVKYNGVSVTNYTLDASRGILYDPNLDHGTTSYLYVEYTIPEPAEEHGATGAGRVPPTIIAPPSMPVIPLAIAFIVVIAGLLFLVLVVSGKL